ncbi:nitroreductase family protein [Paenibacillus mendelii]|uniref:Nitroreductase family protein n=1 Tax=Paenibacillus mendelii TaxID=206163 RepID=A0ABV6JAW3_9BACL|nr:nitroreductase family protein [Paenibacillus mendelii]MCQ6563777.1 nitroreductase family protein [Paenibacillus mendelii]
MTVQVQDTQDFMKVAKGRRSVRSYEPTEISKEDVQEILETATLAPSSSNMQPWRFLVAHDKESKSKLESAVLDFNKQRVAEASVGIVLLGDLKGYEKAEKIYDQAVKAGYMTEENKTQFVKSSLNLYRSIPQDKLKEIVLVDGGLVSMQLMLAARAKGYDTLPMGGYDPVKLKELFGISDQYMPIMVIALGKAAQEGRPTTRLPIEEVTFWNTMD